MVIFRLNRFRHPLLFTCGFFSISGGGCGGKSSSSTSSYGGGNVGSGDGDGDGDGGGVGSGVGASGLNYSPDGLVLSNSSIA